MIEMNILFLADPNSIHDIKWITYFSSKYGCYLISRESPNHKPDKKLGEFNINYVGSIKDYSTLKFWKNGLEAKKLKKVIQLYKIDVFHILYTEPNILWAIYKPKFKIPIIASNRGSDILVTINNTFKSKSLLNYFVSKNYKKAFSQCNYITCTSNSQLNTVNALKLSKQVTLIRTGVDLQAIDRLSKAEVIKGIQKPYVVFPRNMRPVYNHELALKAIKKLPESIKSKYEWVFIDANSSDIEYVTKIKSIIGSIKDTKIHFFYKLTQDALFPLLKNASLAIMTNLSDGSPVSAMEIMYLKTPLLLSPLNYDQAIFSKIITFKEFNSTSVANSIKTMLFQPKEEGLSNIKELIKTTCDRNDEMEKLNMLYQTLTKD